MTSRRHRRRNERSLRLALTAFGLVLCSALGCGRNARVEGADAVARRSAPQFSIEPWEWRPSDERLDFARIDFHATAYRPYFERVSRVELIVPLALRREYPKGATVSEDLLAEYDPDYCLARGPRNECRRYDARRHFERFLAFYATVAPQATVTTYISGSDCRFDDGGPLRWPRDMVDCADFPRKALLWNTFDDSRRFRLDKNDPAVARRLADEIVAEALARGQKAIYLDNITTPHSDNRAFSWDVTCGFLRGIRNRLNARGVKLLINMGNSPGLHLGAGRNYVLSDRVGDAVDGFSFEQPLHPLRTRPYLAKVLDAAAVYRRWLDDDKLVLFYPSLYVGGDEELNRNFLAAFAMLIREPGDAIRVFQRFWIPRERYPWLTWPAEFGPPVGAFTSRSTAGGWVLERSYRNATLTLRHLTTEKNKAIRLEIVTPRDADRGSLELVSPPTHGHLDEGRAVYTPDPDAAGFDGFITRSESDGRTHWDVVGVLVRE